MKDVELYQAAFGKSWRGTTGTCTLVPCLGGANDAIMELVADSMVWSQAIFGA
jgi:hypothetical protein